MNDTKYDIIALNPPYVGSNVLVKYEDFVKGVIHKIAIYGGQNGLFYIKRIFKQAKDSLTVNGRLFLEFSNEQVHDVELLAAKYNWIILRRYTNGYGMVIEGIIDSQTVTLIIIINCKLIT
ncbi:MAG: hypothetical protein JSW07_23260 [bacterium]|nr:MAG: hypothetical protein JSW07_23260 [bacterium]